jgi:hypothetical protein
LRLNIGISLRATFCQDMAHAVSCSCEPAGLQQRLSAARDRTALVQIASSTQVGTL